MTTPKIPFSQIQKHINDPRRKFIEDRGREGYFMLRYIWSGFIILWICVLITFNIVVTWLVGMGLLDYSESKWFINVVMVQTFLQIVALGVIAVRYLFKEN